MKAWLVGGVAGRSGERSGPLQKCSSKGAAAKENAWPCDFINFPVAPDVARNLKPATAPAESSAAFAPCAFTEALLRRGIDALWAFGHCLPP